MSNIYGKSCTPNLGSISDYYTKDEINRILRDKRELDLNFLEEGHTFVGDEANLQRSYELNPDYFEIDHLTQSVSVLSSDQLKSARVFTVTGAVTGNVSTDLSGNVTLAVELSQVAVGKLAFGTPRQLLQVNSAGTSAEWASNIDIPGTLAVTGKTTLDSTIQVGEVAPTLPGEFGWNADEATVDLALSGGIINHLGQSIQLLCRNDAGVTIPKGKAVMFSGTVGNSGRIKIKPMVADSTYPGYVFLGVTCQSIGVGEDGYVTTFGKIKGVNTSTYADGNILWCDPANPGGFTATEPSAPNLKLPVAAVIHAANNGTIMVRWDTGSRLADLHDVDANGSVVDGDLLSYNGTTERWEAKSVDVIGEPGREVELRKTDYYVQWRYVGDPDWIDLIPINEITGPSGDNGTSFTIKGSVELITHLDDIVSPQIGDCYFVNENGSLYVWDGGLWVNIGTVKGDPGKNVEFGLSATHIQWRYEGDVDWIDLVPLADITGPKGDQGESIQLQVNSTHIQWKYPSDLTWTDLIALSALKGDKGDQGDPGLGLPTGGTTGQILVKSSNVNYQTTWRNSPTGDILGTTDTQNISNKTFNNYTESTFTITEDTVNNTFTLNPNNGPIQVLTLTGANRAPVQASWGSGQSITLLVSRTSDLNSINWTGFSVSWKTEKGNSPTLNSSTGGFAVIVMWKVGSTIYGARVGDA